MATEPKGEGNFCIIIASVEEEKIGKIVKDFAQAFSIEYAAAEQVLKIAPVVFLTSLSKTELRTLKPRLLDVSRLGVEFQITTSPSDDLPAVTWPVKPQFSATASGSIISALTFSMGQNAFVCPRCGETFVIRPAGLIQLTKHVEITKKAGPSIAVSSPPKPSLEAKRVPAVGKAAAASEEEEIPEVVPIEEVPEIQPIEEEVGQKPPDLEAEIIPLEEEVEEKAPRPPSKLKKPAPKAAPVVGKVEEAPPEIEEVILIEEEVEEKPKVKKEARPAPKAVAPPKAAAPPAPPAKAVVKPRVKKEEAPPTLPPPNIREEVSVETEAAGDAITCSVFLSRISVPQQRDAAAKLLSEIKGLPLPKAKELVSRTVIPVMKDVSEEEAQQCLDKFKALKIMGRITKKRGGAEI